MTHVRVIPTLLLTGRGIVKTVGFDDPTYIGCAINAVRVFNANDVDELILLDIETLLDSADIGQAASSEEAA